MPILKIECLAHTHTQKNAITLLFIDFDFSPDLQGRLGWFVNLLLYLVPRKKDDTSVESVGEKSVENK